MQEVDIKAKPIVGQGASHTVFPFAKFKDKLIKTRNANYIVNPDGTFTMTKNDRWISEDEVKVMQAFPQFFLKIFKYTKRYVIVEKLNTKDFMREIEKSSKGIFNVAMHYPKLAKIYFPYEVDVNRVDPTDINVSMFLYYLIKNKDEADIIQQNISAHTPNPDFFNELYHFIKSVYNIYPDIDCHDDNLGFNKNKEIRFLDM